MHRFFVNKEQIRENTIEILDKDVKHIKDVLRLKVNDKIEVVSNGHIYVSEILEVNTNSIIANVVEDYLGKNEAPVDIVLYQGIAKGDKMDYIFQKGVEIGIKEFYPVIMDRTIVKIKNPKKEENRLRRWKGIVEEAAKQSKRDILPVVNNIIGFTEMIDILQDEENILIPYEEEKSRDLRGFFHNEKKSRVHIIIGPEGGFEKYEIESLEKIGGEVVSLGPRILRTETAGIVASTVVLYEFGALGGIQ